MKKSIYTFLVLFLSLLYCGQLRAQEETVIYNADFSKGFNEWTATGEYSNQGLWDASQGVLNAYGYMATDPCTSCLVSPEITLPADNNTVTFDHQGFYFNDMSQEAQLLVREVGGEWVMIEGVQYPADMDFSVLNSGKLAVPEAFGGKTVQFAFQYKVISMATIGNWFIYYFKVMSSGSAAPDDRQEAGISYDVDKVTYTIGDGGFETPVLNNPNGLAITYASDNEAVASVSEDGIVTINGAGETIIRAASCANDKFKAGEASFMLTVTDPDVVFSASFATGDCGFAEDEATAAIGGWMHVGWDGCIMADAYEKVSEMTAFYYVSPEFTLDASGNTCTFDQMCSYFTDIETQAQLLIRETGGEWINLTGVVYPIDEGVQWHSAGTIEIPASLNGKKVQVAFKYSSDGLENSGIWYIRNFVVSRTGVPTGIGGVQADDARDGKVYDLQGRRVSNPGSGIYIRDGKKMIIR